MRMGRKDGLSTEPEISDTSISGQETYKRYPRMTLNLHFFALIAVVKWHTVKTILLQINLLQANATRRQAFNSVELKGFEFEYNSELRSMVEAKKEGSTLTNLRSWPRLHCSSRKREGVEEEGERRGVRATPWHVKQLASVVSQVWVQIQPRPNAFFSITQHESPFKVTEGDR